MLQADYQQLEAAFVQTLGRIEMYLANHPAKNNDVHSGNESIQ